MKAAMKVCDFTIGALLLLLPIARSAHAASFSFTTIDVPFSDAGAFTQLDMINPNGRIVGFYINNSGIVHAFLDDHSSFTPIDFPGAATTIPTWISATGEITGVYAENNTFN